MSKDNQYALGRTPKEYARLARQAEILAPMTRRLFEDAGISSGMCVLDLGSGAGDVCMMLSGMVGPQGSVIGLDLDGNAVAHARERAVAAGIGNIEYLPCEFADYAPARPVDAVVGRLVLMYQHEPAAALASAVRHLRPGGIVAFLEPWFQSPPGPDCNLVRSVRGIVETLRRSGAHVDLGPRLHRVFQAAGLPVPAMRWEARMDGAPGSPLYQYIADTLESLMPKAIEYGIAKPGDFDVAQLPALMETEVQSAGYAMMVAPLVAAWCRSA
jgi:SAM-dependent methyltransferase